MCVCVGDIRPARGPTRLDPMTTRESMGSYVPSGSRNYARIAICGYCCG